MVQTNQHAHEYEDRPSGHYKIFLAGPSGTQLTTANQLTFDRVIFSAPQNKYAHIWSMPTSGAQDPGNAFLPLKLVDPTGAYLPEGTYNFIFAWFWSTSEEPQQDIMIPDYSSSFDIVISNDADADEGAITECVKTNPDCSNYLVGVSESPGAKDTTDPWPPFKDNYIFTNFDGDDPSTENGKRTFQPYWTEFVEASKAPAISTGAPWNVKEASDGELAAMLPVAGGAEWPESVDVIPRMPAGGGKGLPVTQEYKPMSIEGATPVASPSGASAGNGTVSGGTTSGGNMTEETATGDSTTDDATTTTEDTTQEYPATDSANTTGEPASTGEGTTKPPVIAEKYAADDECEDDEPETETSRLRRHARSF